MKTLKLSQLAAVGIVAGVILHVCAAYVILGSGGNGGSGAPDAPVRQATAIAQQQTPVPTTLPDRQNCDAIRNTEYRSPTERQWFLSNCTGAFAPSPIAQAWG